jgi:hypothetical protein
MTENQYGNQYFKVLRRSGQLKDGDLITVATPSTKYARDPIELKFVRDGHVPEFHPISRDEALELAEMLIAACTAISEQGDVTPSGYGDDLDVLDIDGLREAASNWRDRTHRYQSVLSRAQLECARAITGESSVEKIAKVLEGWWKE